MNRSILFVLAIVAPALGACASAPSEADLRAALTAPCEKAGDNAPWVIMDAWQNEASYKPEAQFRPDGVMIYGYDGGTYDNGRWTLSGNALQLGTNKGQHREGRGEEFYATYNGVFDGKSASGTMTNVADNAGQWTLVRDCNG